MEKLDQIKGGSEDQISVSGQTRSYTCNFCKRGFSNAQALGGHMNIHRRDRARIRQLSEENKNNNDQVSSDTNTMIKNINPPFDINDRPYSASLSEDKSSRGSTTTSFQLERLSEQQSGVTNNKNPYSMVRDEDQLYHEQAMGSNRGNMVFGGDEVAQQIPFFTEESSDKVIPAEKRTEELDLELRLGPERRDASTKLSTREFF